MKKEIPVIWFMMAAMLPCAVLFAPPKKATVQERCPENTGRMLAHAVLADLPKGMVLRGGTFSILEKDLEADIEKAPHYLRTELRTYIMFQLEQTVKKKLFLDAARQRGDKKTPPQTAIKSYLETVTAKANVSNKTARDFYDKNQTLFAGASYATVQSGIKQHLLQLEKHHLADHHVLQLSRQTAMEISEAWLKSACFRMKNTPIGKARAGGRPTLVNFGAEGCCGPRMSGVLNAVRGKVGAAVNVFFIDVRQTPVQAAWYNVRTQPMQIYFGREGKEVHRHSGFMSYHGILSVLKKQGLLVN